MNRENRALDDKTKPHGKSVLAHLQAKLHGIGMENQQLRTMCWSANCVCHLMGSQLILMWIFLFDDQRKANTIRLPISLNFVDT